MDQEIMETLGRTDRVIKSQRLQLVWKENKR